MYVTTVIWTTLLYGLICGGDTRSDHNFEVRSVSSSETARHRNFNKKLINRRGPHIPKIRVKRDIIANNLPSDILPNDVSSSRFNDTMLRGNSTNGLNWKDPLYHKQWYLQNGAVGNFDMNVREAWAAGYTGRNVVVSILDDGLQWTHPDLIDNYDPEASIDMNDRDDDPTPRIDGSNGHGTRCAGIVAATAGNNHCGVGIAYRAKIGGIRMLDGPVTDFVEARSLRFNRNHIDIYVATWGPNDDGNTFDGPGALARHALNKGIKEGRNGLGSIFMWGSGIGGHREDSCSCDGYATSIYTISVSSATRNLTWRDVQHLIVRTSNPIALLDNDGWITNGAGRKVSSKFGFGLMDAGKMVQVTEKWETVPELTKCTFRLTDDEIFKPVDVRDQFYIGSRLDVGSANANIFKQCNITYIEHVQSRIKVEGVRRGDLELTLISPQGTKSLLLPERPRDTTKYGVNESFWPFSSVQFWGENAPGRWWLIARNVGTERNNGTIGDWELTIWGTTSPAQPGDIANPRVEYGEIPE